MPSIQIKAVPNRVHATLKRRAALAGQSLQEYLLGRLTAEADRPTLEEVFERVGHRTGGSVSFDAAVDSVRSDRDSR